MFPLSEGRERIITISDSVMCPPGAWRHKLILPHLRDILSTSFSKAERISSAGRDGTKIP
jgi:hypothetical protein